MSQSPRAGKSRLGLAAILVTGAFASSVDARAFVFDSDGPGSNPPINASGLDWSVGNTLATSRIPALVGATFQQYYQATLAGVIDNIGNTVQPAGLNSTYEVTAVARVTHVVTSVSAAGGNTTVTSQIVQATNSFFEIWSDSTRDASNLAGTGFNDGTRILLGGPNQDLPNFTSYVTTPFVEAFDQFGADNYPNTNSILGTGAMTYEGLVSSSDPAFFLGDVTSFSFNTSQVTPFKQTDPSQLFAGLPGGVPPAVVPNIGAINGATGPDFQFQADANSAFVVVPEPASFAGALLASTALFARRRLRR